MGVYGDLIDLHSFSLWEFGRVKKTPRHIRGPRLGLKICPRRRSVYSTFFPNSVETKFSILYNDTLETRLAWGSHWSSFPAVSAHSVRMELTLTGLFGVFTHMGLVLF